MKKKCPDGSDCQGPLECLFTKNCLAPVIKPERKEK